MHLVSVEGRYDATTGEFDFDNASGSDTIRLISLTSWRFACVSSDHSFTHMTKALARNHRAFRLPSNVNSAAETFLASGFIPVRHELRQGGKTLSWYRGPLVTGPQAESVTLPTQTTDSLLHYHASVGMFDVSHASAWELGRLMALQSPSFSTALYHWKRQRNQQHKASLRSEQQQHPLQAPQNAFQNASQKAVDMPVTVETWLAQLAQLQGVPFKYLVPNEALLPVESIRFFQIDMDWIRCLLDGAYSMGRITQADFECDRLTHLPLPYTQATGVMIRSDIISGYPGLLIEAYDQQGTQRQLVSQQNLSPNIRLCLFEGELSHLDIRQKPEALHAALEMIDDENYNKRLRNHSLLSGKLKHKRVAPISQLANDVEKSMGLNSRNQFNAGTFASQLLESAEKVSFYQTL